MLLLHSWLPRWSTQRSFDAAAFQLWLPRLQAKDPTLRQATTLLPLFRSVAADPAMGMAQDDIFDQLYYQPAAQRAKEYHLNTPLAWAFGAPFDKYTSRRSYRTGSRGIKICRTIL